MSVRSVGSQFVCRSISAGSLGSCPRLFRSRSSPDSKWSRAFAFRRWTNMSIHGDITAAHSKRGFLNVPDGGNLLACPTCLNIHVNGIFVSGGSHEIHLNCSLHHKSSPTKSSISIIPALPPASRHFVYIALRTTANGCEKNPQSQGQTMMQGLVSAAARPPARGPLPSPGGASKQASKQTAECRLLPPAPPSPPPSPV